MTTPDSIEREIADARKALGRQLSQAEEKAREAIDWKTHYRRNPMAMLAAATAAGFVASALFDSHDHPGNGNGSRLGFSAAAAPVNGAMTKMMEALVAAASFKAAEFIEPWLPGFHQEFTRRQL